MIGSRDEIIGGQIEGWLAHLSTIVSLETAASANDLNNEITQSDRSDLEHSKWFHDLFSLWTMGKSQ